MNEGQKFYAREPTEEETARIEQNFTYHAPHGDQVERYSFIRNIVREAVFWANAAIARNEAKHG